MNVQTIEKRGFQEILTGGLTVRDGASDVLDQQLRQSVVPQPSTVPLSCPSRTFDDHSTAGVIEVANSANNRYKKRKGSKFL